MAIRFPLPYAEWIDGNGFPLAGGLLYFYASGTSTPLATYSDVSLSTPNTNPVVANADGWWGAIYLQVANYKVVLKTSAGVQIWSADPVSGTAGGGGSGSGNIRTTTISSNIVLTDGTVIVNSAGATTQTLPAANAATGLAFTVFNANVGQATIAGTINGATNYILAFQNSSVTVQSDGTSWIII